MTRRLFASLLPVPVHCVTSSHTAGPAPLTSYYRQLSCSKHLFAAVWLEAPASSTRDLLIFSVFNSIHTGLSPLFTCKAN